MIFGMKTLFSIVALALCVSTPVFAQQPYAPAETSAITTADGSCHYNDGKPHTVSECRRDLAEGKAKQERDGTAPPDRYNCWTEATGYMLAASYRDSGFSPQSAVGYLKAAMLQRKPTPPDRWLKKTINMVYFDNSFQGVGSNAMFTAVLQDCLHPDSGYKPLK